MNHFLKHFRDYLRAVSCSFFINNAWLGALFLCLLGVFNPEALAAVVVTTMTGYAYSVRISTPRILKSQGLIVINELFFALALSSLFKPSLGYFLFLGVGALAVPLLTKASHELMQHWKLSVYNGPYMLMIWVAWLCQPGSTLEARSHEVPLYSVHSFESLPPWMNVVAQIVRSSFYSIGTLLYVGNIFFGVLLLTLVTVFRPRGGLYLFTGTFIAALTAHWFSSATNAANYGVYAYSAGLVGLALASSPETFRAPTILFFCSFSALLTMSLAQLFGKLGLPVLSAPFVLTLWTATLSRTPRMNIAWTPLQALTSSFKSKDPERERMA